MFIAPKRRMRYLVTHYTAVLLNVAEIHYTGLHGKRTLHTLYFFDPEDRDRFISELDTGKLFLIDPEKIHGLRR